MAIQEILLKCLANVAPYLINLSKITCLKLFKLLKALSSPRYLLGSEFAHYHTSYLLDTINHLIVYQGGNIPYIVYLVVIKKEIFEALDAMSFESAVLEYGRLKQHKIFDASKTLVHSESIESTVTNGTIDSIETMNNKGKTRLCEPLVRRFVPKYEWFTRAKSLFNLKIIKTIWEEIEGPITLLKQQNEGNNEEACFELIMKWCASFYDRIRRNHFVTVYKSRSICKSSFLSFYWSNVFSKSGIGMDQSETAKQCPLIWSNVTVSLFKINNKVLMD